MSLLSFNLSVDQNADSNVYTWTVRGSNGGLTDLTGAAARMMIRSQPSVAPLVSLTNTLSSQGQLVLGGVQGTIALNLTKAATALLVGQSPNDRTSAYIYDLFVDFPNGTSLSIVSGAVNVSLAVTHT